MRNVVGSSAHRSQVTSLPAPRVQLGLPAVAGPSFDLGAPFAQHESWETGMVPRLGDGRRFGDTEPKRRSPGASGPADPTLGWLGDGSGEPVRRSVRGEAEVLGDLGLNVPVPRTHAGVVANAVVARLMRLKRPSTRAYLRWDSPNGRPPYVWRIHAPEVAQANVRLVLREVLREKGAGGIHIFEQSGPDYDPETGIPGWFLALWPAELPLPTPDREPPPGPTGAATTGPRDAPEGQEQSALEQYGPLIATLLQQAYETDPRKQAEVLEARIANLERRKVQLPAFLQAYVDDRLSMLRARQRAADASRRVQEGEERSVRVWRVLGYVALGAGIAASVGVAALFGTAAKALHDRRRGDTDGAAWRPNPSHRRGRSSRRGGRRRR